MGTRASTVLLGALKLIVVVAGAAVIGAVLGGGRQAFSGAPATPPLNSVPRTQDVGQTAAGSSTGATPQLSATTTDATAARKPAGRVEVLDLGEDVTVRVVSARFQPAETADGRARERGRLAVDVRVHNTSGRTATPPVARLFIRAGGDTVRPDVNASEAGGAALLPIAPGATAAGQLRFETAGPLTGLLRDATMVNIRYGPQRVPVRIG